MMSAMSMFRSLNPATGQTVWEGPRASAGDVHQAVLTARQAQGAWRQLDFERRVQTAERFAELVRRHHDELAQMISLETGKPLWEARGEVGAAANKVAISVQAHLERTGTRSRSLPEARSVVRHRPHGVVAVLGPYNFPLHLPNGHIVPALLAANAVVFKPSEHTPRCGERAAELWADAGLPDGVLTVVQGGGETGRALAQSQDVDGIFFTGSAQTGAALHRQFGGTPNKILALEMGGNNPLIVDQVKDIDAAVIAIVYSAYLTAGQRCTCARRLFVPDGDWGDQLLRRLVDTVRKLKVGAFDESPEPFMGPVISEAVADALLESEANLTRIGGTPLSQMVKLREGTGFLSPSLIDVTKVRSLPDEEYFGPLLQVIRYRSFDEAIDLANQTRFGLAAGLLSDERARYDLFLERIVAGVVNWNRPLTGASSGAPFGGVGVSGNHRPSAYYAADYCAYPVASLEAEVLSVPENLSPGVSL